LGPYKVLLTVFREMLKYYSSSYCSGSGSSSSSSSSSRISYLVLLELCRSFANKVCDVVGVDKSFKSLMGALGGSRLEEKVECDDVVVVLKSLPVVMDVLQARLSEFQAVVVEETKRHLHKKNRLSSL